MDINSAKIMVNNRCNLRCSYCCLTPQKKKELDVNGWVALLTHLKNNFNTQYIDLFGKEPLFDSKAFDIIRALDNKGIEFNYSMITNGVNIKRYYKDIVELLNSISVSYSGLDKGREYIFDTNTITKISRTTCVEISYDLQKANKANLMSDLKMFWNIGVGSVYIKPILDYNKVSSDYAISEEEYREIVESLINFQSFSEIPYLAIHIPFIFPKLTKLFKGVLPTSNYEIQYETKCLCDGSFIFIDCDGTAYPCGECLSLDNKTVGFDYMKTPVKGIQEKLKSNGERLCMVRR